MVSVCHAFVLHFPQNVSKSVSEVKPLDLLGPNRLIKINQINSQFIMKDPMPRLRRVLLVWKMKVWMRAGIEIRNCPNQAPEEPNGIILDQKTQMPSYKRIIIIIISVIGQLGSMYGCNPPKSNHKLHCPKFNLILSIMLNVENKIPTQNCWVRLMSKTIWMSAISHIARTKEACKLVSSSTALFRARNPTTSAPR